MTDPLNTGKFIFFIGIVIAVLGLLIMLGSKFNLFNLPGDISFGGKNWGVFMPIGSCILLSAAISIILWIINHFFK